jgi:hypothetical protein
MEDIKQKILGLMAKTTGNGCTEEEAMAASQKVQEMLNKYQLSLSDIKIKESNCVNGFYDTQLKAHSAVSFCIAAIGNFTDTKTWWYQEYNGRIYYKFFGLEHDVIIAEYITKLCDWAIIHAGEDFRGHPAYVNSTKRSKVLGEFKQAMATRISKRLRDMKAAQESRNASDGRSLIIVKSALVSEEWAKLHIKLTRPGPKGKEYTSAEAYNAGTAAGDKVQINPGINKGKAHMELT